MKMDRKPKAEQSPPAVKTAKGGRRAAPKSNGKHPLAMYEHIPIGIVEAALDGKYIDVNEEFCRILGYSRQELLGLGIKDCTHEDDYGLDAKLFENLITGKIPFYRLEKRYLRKGGGDIWVELTRTLVCDAKGKPLYTVGVVLDISDRKDVERVLRDSVERLRLATGAAHMFMWEWDFQTQTYTIADSFEQVLGFSAGLLPKNKFETLWALSPREDLERISEAFERAVEQQKDLHALPYRVINPENGQVVWLEISAKIIYDYEGKPERMFGVAQNITENKHAQDEIAVISRMPAENPNPVMRLLPNGSVLYANPAAQPLVEDWRQEDGRTIPQEVQEAITQAFASGYKTEVELAHRGKFFSCTLAPIHEAGYVNFYGNDITARKEAELALRRSEANLWDFLENASVGIHWVDQNGIIVWANQAELDMLGYTKEEYLGQNISAFHVDPPIIENILERLRQGETLDNYEARLRHKDGSIRYGTINSNVLWEDGKFIYTRCFTRDITEQKQAEEQLRESEERFRALVSQATAGIAESDTDSRLIFVNPGLCEMLGYSEAELLGKTIWELTYTEDLEENQRLFKRMVEQGESYQFEKRFIRKDSSTLWTTVSVTSVHDVSGKTKGGVGVVVDIEKRKQAEAALTEYARQQAALYRLSDELHRTESLADVFDAALDAILNALQCDRASILLFDESSVMRFVAWRGLSNTYRKATEGHSPWAPDAKDPQPVVMDDVRRAELSGALRAVVQAEGIGSLAFIPLLSNGKLIGKFMVYFDAPHKFEEPELDLSLTIARQLSAGIDRKQAEEQLRAKEAELEQVINHTPFMLTRCSRDLRYRFVSRAYAELIGQTPEEVAGQPIIDIMGEDGFRTILPYVEKVLEGHQVEFEAQVSFQKRVAPFLHVVYTPDRDERGNVIGWFASIVDITERKMAENRLALLAEISEMLRNFDDPYELMYKISESVGEHLHVKRALFNEIDLEHDLEIVHRDYHQGLDSVAGSHKVSDYSSLTSAEVAAGRTVVNRDAKTDPRTAQDYERTYAISKERAYVAVPLMRENRWVATFWVSDDTPRQWMREEVSLLETVAERTWAVIEKLRLNAELRRSISFDEAVMNSMGEGLYTVDKQGRVVFMNPAAEKLFGWTLEELRGRKIHDVTHYQRRDGTPLAAEDCAELHVLHSGKPLISYQDVFIRKDGTFFDVTYSSSPLRSEDGSITGLVVVFEDTTEHKRYEQALRKSEERYRFIVENTSDGIWWIELAEPMPLSLSEDEQIDWYYEHAVIRQCNLGMARMYGYESIEEVIGVPLRAVMPRENPVNLELSRQFVRSGYRLVDAESRERDRNGRELVFLNNMVGIIEDGKLKGEWGTNRDITQRKRAEEALRTSESLYRAIARSIPGGGVYVIDKDFRYLVAEGPVTEAFGLTREMLEGHIVSEVFPPEPSARMQERLQRNFAGETVSFETKHNGRVYWTQQAPLLDSIGHVIVVTLDITERKQAEESLRASELRYRNLFDLVPVAVYSCDADGVIQEYNHRAVELWGRQPQNERYCGSHKIYDLDGRFMPHAECPMARVLHGETLQPHEFEILVEREDGMRRNVIAHPLLLRNEQGEITGAINCLYDITERKQAEEALRQSDERFAHFMQHLPGLAWIKDMEGRYVYANAAAEKAFNTSQAKLYGQRDEDIFPREVAEQFHQNDMLALTDEKGVQVIETLKHADGVLHSSLVSKFPIPGPDGSTTLIGGTAFDITERLQAEEALRESEERFRAILRQATAGIVRKDAEGRLTYVNQAFCNMLGYSESELIGKTVWEFMHPDDVLENKRSYDRLMLEGIPFKLERRFLRRNGSVIWVDASVSPIIDAAGKPQSAVAVEVDITGRRKAEEALQQLNLQLEERILSRTAKLRAVNQTLREEITERKKIEEALRKSEATARENEEKLSTLFNLLPVGISFLNPGGKIIQMNPALKTILKLPEEQGPNEAYRFRKYIRANGSIMPPREFASQRALTEGKTVYNLETGVILDDGEMLWTSVSAAPVNVADVGCVVVTVDITKSKRAERALQESRERLQILSQRLVEVQEEERRAIARELHDRVGQTLAALNINLIIISGQLGGKVDEQISTRLSDSMKLVAETIALVRDVMSNLRPSVLDDYGLEAALESHLTQFTSRYEIQTRFEKPAQSIPRLGPSIEMTFLRIAQEALMNIAKHAQASHVTLSLQREENMIRMLVQDNGAGIRSWQEANRAGSHGLTIMRERAEAFGGSLAVSSTPGEGTKVEVKIPIETNEASSSAAEKSQ